MTEISPDVLRAIAVERERRRDEVGWCAQVTLPNGAMLVSMFDVTRGVCEDAVIAALHRWPTNPSSMQEYHRVQLWRNERHL